MSQQKPNVIDDRLALLGGPAAVDSPPPLWPFFDHMDREALNAVLDSRVWGGYHEAVAELERRFAAFQARRATTSETPMRSRISTGFVKGTSSERSASVLKAGIST